MISLVLAAAVAAGAVNVALVAFMADRLGPKAGTASAGEFAATFDATPAATKRGAVKVGNQNDLPLAARRAA